MKILLSLLVLLNILDGGITHLLVWLGFASERNPFLAKIAGEPAFMSLKVLGAIFCAAVLWDVNRRHPNLARGVTLAGVLAYAVIVIWTDDFLAVDFLKVSCHLGEPSHLLV